MSIFCIGDSNTYGYDPRSYLGSRYPEEVRWTGRLSKWDVINRGINGMTVLRANSVFRNLVRKAEPDLFVVMLGTNDIIVGTSAEETAERMEGFLSALADSGRPILLIAPPALQYGEWVQDGELIEESENLQELYRELAEEKGYMFADAGEWGISLTYDGVHFSPEGHAVFAERMKEILEEKLNER